uniref:Short-chain type dehydrogenase/reductase-like n=1 Tax=Rhizophora mucronata TaxID=61149 RepID=A0A2P2JUH7_RHIMU
MATANSTTSSSIPPTPPSLPLQDRVAIVTGSSRGIGKAIAAHLASLGARVVINYVSNKEQARLVAEEINSCCSSLGNDNTTPRAIVVQGDVSEPAHVKLLFDEAERVFGSQVHVLVNSGAIADINYPSIATTSLEDFDRICSVNFRGSFLCCKEAANRIKRGGGGRIIMLSSVLASSLRPNVAPTYTATKAAVEAMTKILAKELKGTSITANCVAPGPIATDMFLGRTTEEIVKLVINECPLGRLGETKDVAPVVGFLVSDAGEWVNGQVIGVTGGYV